jgi:hypothetical protein
MLQKIRDYFEAKRGELVMGLVAAGGVLVVYVVVNLIMWNDANFSYAVIYALTAFVLYYILRRFLNYFMAKKAAPKK